MARPWLSLTLNARFSALQTTMLLTLCLALLLVLGTGSCSSPPPSGPGEARLQFDGEVPDWAEDTEGLLAELSQWRQKPYTEDLDVSFVAKKRHLPNGWYDPQSKELVVTTGNEVMSRAVLLHEAFHALQDQHFDLVKLRHKVDSADADLALSALIEGEAMLAVTELMDYDFLAHSHFPDRGAVHAELIKNQFLYGDGLKFVLALREAGGWAAVDAAWADPPRSTALILAPERYLAGERGPVTVTVPRQENEAIDDPISQGAFALRHLLASNEDSRSLLAEFETRYRGDTLAHVTNADGTESHRWVIELAEDVDDDRLLTALVQAMGDHHQPPEGRRQGNLLLLDWAGH